VADPLGPLMEAETLRRLVLEPWCPKCGEPAVIRDGTVGTLDVLKVLEYWDDPNDPDDWGFGNTHFLAIVGNWGDCE